MQTHHQTTIVDSAAQTRYFYPYSRDGRVGYYPVYYIGPRQDTLYLGASKIYGYQYGQKDYDRERKRFTWVDSLSMKIVVDTAFHLTYAELHYIHNKHNHKDVISYVSYHKAFPVYVYNLTDSLIWLGKFSELGSTVRQAKDSQGKWVDIEKPIRYYCGTGAREIVLEPRQCLVAKLLRYKGSYKTACRLRYTNAHRTVYSNTFTDYIDPRQLTDKLELEDLALR
ncbi:hypothetical protein LRS06_11785 [Hymenobacter sp. J193]|uniref:hypothetical protein n=1 Tax=Hymenobacter sp. J193 TaxID=2898429 RepID=UPI002150C73C|nr:hypothetical protein [Hymenobacter sp. J193]MCR5888435.1 hypothetical protein [Hymenobacter sp. J193]